MNVKSTGSLRLPVLSNRVKRNVTVCGSLEKMKKSNVPFTGSLICGSNEKPSNAVDCRTSN